MSTVYGEALQQIYSQKTLALGLVLLLCDLGHVVRICAVLPALRK